MTRTPPLLPEQALIRVVRIGRINGMSILLVAGFFALLSAVGGDFVGAAAGLIVAGAGAMEVHGATLLTHGERRGANWLVSSELVALVGILVYCAVRIMHVQLPPVPDELKPLIDADAKQFGMTTQQFLLQSYRTVFVIVAVVSVFYQGGIAAYYARRRPTVMRALDSDPEL